MMNAGLIKKIYKVAAVFLICWALAAIYLYNSKKIEEAPEPVFQNKKYQSTQIKKFQASIVDGVNKVLTIKGDSYTVEKKKIGFLRTSLINEAVLKNGIIDLYSNSLLNSSDKIQESKITFKNALSKDTLSSIHFKKAGTIRVVPVCIHLFQDDNLVTEINALSGILRIRQKSILFKGNVRVESGNSTLITEHLSFNPDNATIQTDTAYELITEKGHFHGKGFKSNIYLQSESKGK